MTARSTLRATIGGVMLCTASTLAAPGASSQQAPAQGVVAQAVPPRAAPAGPAAVSVVARDQPIAAFLRDLFGRIGRPVVPSPKLTGTVNGVFRGSVNEIYRQVARAFSLVSYDDGAALYVYASSEMRVETLQLDPAIAQRVQRQVASQRLADGRNLVRVAPGGGLVASGTPRFIEQVQSFARSGGAGEDVAGPATPRGGGYGGGYASPPPPTAQPLEFRVFYLRYARAEDTLVTAGGREMRVPGLATILQNLVLDQRPGGSAGTPVQFGARPVRQSAQRLGGSGLAATAPGAGQLPSPGFGYGPDVGYTSTDVLGGDGGGLVAPLTADVVRIEPSPYLNAIIVRDVPERMNAYDSLVRALDVEPQIVQLEATIIDINIDKLRELGINWRLSTGGFGALFGSGDTTDLNGSNDLRLSRNRFLDRRDNQEAITPSRQGGTISTIIGSQREFLARINALETRGAARVVSRPQIVTLSNVEAVFDRTRTFYVRVAGDRQVDLFNVTAGTVLRVNPHVFRDQDQTRIRVMVNIEDGSISPTSAVENIPIVDRATVATQAMVLDGESLLLGGMTIDADLDTEYKIPLLGDIPLLGELFKSRSRSRNRTERLFLITPRLTSLAERVGPTTVNRMSTPAQPETPAATVPVPAVKPRP